MTLVLEVEAVSFAYGTRVLFDRLSFSVAEGESVAVTGPSGCGKSTLLKVVLGLLPVAGGTVRVAGDSMSGRSREKTAGLRRKHVGSVFQHGELLPELTPVENVMVPALLAGTSSPVARERARTLLEAVGVDADVPMSSDRLSGGERQRTALARALINRPALVVADEPTGALDPETREAVADIVLGAPADFGCGLVIVTHEVSIAQKADRWASLAGGQLTWQ